MRQIIFLFLLTTISNLDIAQNQKVEILFADNGVEKKLNNDFNVYFVFQDSTQKVVYKSIVIDKKYISIPSQMPINKELKYYILFEYNRKIYYCDYSKYLYFHKAEALLIHIQKRPFYKYVAWGQNEFYILPRDTDMDNDKKIRGEMKIVYGKGDNAATYTRIYNFKEYFKKGEGLLKW